MRDQESQHIAPHHGAACAHEVAPSVRGTTQARLERLIELCAERAYFAGLCDHRTRWAINARRCERLKRMRRPEVVGRMENERLARCKHREG